MKKRVAHMAEQRHRIIDCGECGVVVAPPKYRWGGKIALTVIMVLVIAINMAGCGRVAEQDREKLTIISTIFPGYDFAREICADKAEISVLLPPGLDSHSYEPSAQDIIAIQNSDLFIYVGGESDSWIDVIFESTGNPIKTVRMMDYVTIVEEEITEGMEEEEEGAHIEQVEEIEYDQHVWTSPQNAVAISRGIEQAVCSIDAANSQVYKTNADVFVEKLNNLDKAFADFFATVGNKTMIFGSRFPLRYFAERYGIDYFAAFPGCSAESEPNFSTIAYLISKAQELDALAIYYIELTNTNVAESIAETTGIKPVLFHSCHNLSKADMENNATYLSLMRSNLETLKETMK